MSKNKLHPEILASAIHASYNGYPLSEEEQQALEEYEQTNSISDLPMDWNALAHRKGSNERAREAWAILEKQLKEPQPAVVELVPKPDPVRPVFTLRRIVAAAVIIICAGVPVFFYLNRSGLLITPRMATTKSVDFPAGTNRAMLLLSNNKTIILTEKQQGLIAADGDASINNAFIGDSKLNKVFSGGLIYKTITGNHKQTSLNFLSTPRAGAYRVTLSDGTTMYVNAESRVEYPANFNDSIRLVTLQSGEAYFDVARDEKKPFIVKISGCDCDVRAKGTEFNINTYADKGFIKTTLVKGAISIKANGLYDLHENQQAVWSRNGIVQVRDNVEMKDEISWKDGFFSFHDSDLESIMKQAARWYDIQEVDIKNKEKWATDLITTKIPRDASLDKFMKTLAYERFDFTITEDRKVIIKDL